MEGLGSSDGGLGAAPLELDRPRLRRHREVAFTHRDELGCHTVAREALGVREQLLVACVTRPA